jgi:restriction system protein
MKELLLTGIIFFITLITTIAIILKTFSPKKKQKSQEELNRFIENSRIEREKNAQKAKESHESLKENAEKWKAEEYLKTYETRIKQQKTESNTPRPTPSKPSINYEAILRAELAETQPPIRITENEKPNTWTLEVLMSLEWKRFEEICNEYLIMLGHNARLTRNGADGGIDIEIWKENTKVCLVQCKAWIWKIGVKEIRELYGIMASENAKNGIYITTSSFTQEAITFRQGKNIRLIDGKTLISKIQSLEIDQQNYLLSLATAGDYTTPTCARCNSKMIKRSGNNGKKDFWGCLNYPRCRNTLQVRSA